MSDEPIEGQDTKELVDNFRGLSDESRERAAARLLALDFTKVSPVRWSGELGLNASELELAQPTAIRIEVELPDQFPGALPAVFVASGQLPDLFPHLEPSGKLCVVPQANVSLDIWRPEAVIDEVLDKARVVLQSGLAGAASKDIPRELLAYWNGAPHFVWSIANSEELSRPLFAAEVVGGTKAATLRLLVAESRLQAEAWTRKVGWEVTASQTNAYFLRLDQTLLPPTFGEKLTLGTWLDRLKHSASGSEWSAFLAWLDRVRLPGLLVVSLPSPEATLRTLIGVLLPKPSAEDAKTAAKGFRPSKVTALRQLPFAGKQSLTKLTPQRLDGRYMQQRGGGEPLLGTKSITVLGCGSVGSFLALSLASLGVGRLALIDREELGPENVHRHLLGVADVGSQKAVATAKYLERQFPHQTVEGRHGLVEDLLQSEPSLLLDVDMVVIALGEEALERRLNSALSCKVPRVHTWVEPLGVGGHVLLTGMKGERGCYECLFHGADNKASLCAADQDLGRTLAGCAGLHFPFSSLDAIRTATEAARIIASALLGGEAAPLLFTWRGEDGEFERQGFALSDRGTRLAPGSTLRHVDFSRLDCPTCTAWYELSP